MLFKIILHGFLHEVSSFRNLISNVFTTKSSYLGSVPFLLNENDE